MVQEGVVFALFPGEYPPCEGSLFLIALPFPPTLFGRLGAFLSPVKLSGQAVPVSHLCQLVYSSPLHNIRYGIYTDSENTQRQTVEIVATLIEVLAKSQKSVQTEHEAALTTVES